MISAILVIWLAQQGAPGQPGTKWTEEQLRQAVVDLPPEVRHTEMTGLTVR
jgi:hypothetical protein